MTKKAGEAQRKIAVHCAAGLGRAPFLVAIALIHAGMDNFEAVDLIRGVRRGAINTRQLDYILAYKVHAVMMSSQLCSIIHK
jgi:protein tyrosine phosphatase type 4A